MYHGKQRGIDPKQLSRYACVLTTYTTMGMEAASKEDLRQGSSVSQPDDLPDSDEEDNTAALPGDNMTNQPVQELSRVLCVVTDRLSSTCYMHSFKAIKAIRRQSIFLLESFCVSSVEFLLCTKKHQQQNQRQQHHRIPANLNRVLRNMGLLSKRSGAFATLAATFMQKCHLLWGQYAWCLMAALGCVLWECPTPRFAGIARHMARMLIVFMHFRQLQQQREEEVGRAPFPDLLVAGGPG